MDTLSQLTLKSFASDNYAGVHPKVLEALASCNKGHVSAYGNDPLTEKSRTTFKRHFGPDAEVFFVFNGTAANVLGIQAISQSFEAVICADSAHIETDECGAVEKFTGSKLIPLPTPHGKLTLSLLEPVLEYLGNQHHVQPKVISISQSTERGTLYQVSEIEEICQFAHQHHLYVHMDGARLSNAAASLNLPLKALTTDCGVDLLSFGGTKNGLMYGEAVVFLNSNLPHQAFQYIRKQGMQLASKMRFIAAQFHALLDEEENLWQVNAHHANQMAIRLAVQLAEFPQVQITQPIEANAIFAEVPRPLIETLQSHFPFYIWNETTNEVRWMTAFDTTEEDINQFIALLRESCRAMV